MYDLSCYKAFNIIQIGCGGTGSHLVPLMSQMLGVSDEKYLYSYTLIDNDLFEEKNLKNQRFPKHLIGENKAKALAEVNANIRPDLNISYMPIYIKDYLELTKIICDKKYKLIDNNSTKCLNIIIGCVDNNEARKIMSMSYMSPRIGDTIYIDSGNGILRRTGQIVIAYKEVFEITRGYTTYIKSNMIQSCIGEVYDLDAPDDEAELSCALTQNIGTNSMAANLLFQTLNNIISYGYLNRHIIYFNAEEVKSISR